MKRSLRLLPLLTTGLLAVSSAAPILQGQISPTAKYPTMLDMTFPEFEAAVKKTDIVLLPTGAIEEHNAHLPLGTDAMNATAQTVQVQHYLRNSGVETIVGPPLNIGITNEAATGCATAPTPIREA